MKINAKNYGLPILLIHIIYVDMRTSFLLLIHALVPKFMEK